MNVFIYVCKDPIINNFFVFDIFFFYSDDLALRIDYVCSSKIFTLLMLKLRLFWQDKKNCKPKRIESILIHFFLAKSQKNYFFVFIH